MVSKVRIRLPSRQKKAALLTGSSTHLMPLKRNLVCAGNDSESIQHVPGFILSIGRLVRYFRQFPGNYLTTIDVPRVLIQFSANVHPVYSSIWLD
jgi:hypothetical protein